MPLGRTRHCKGWFAPPLFQSGVVAICIALATLHAPPQQATAQTPPPTLDFGNLVFEADTLSRSEDGDTLVLRGNVILDDGQRTLIADKLTLTPSTARAEAIGRVALDLGDGKILHSDALLLEQSASTLLLSGLATRLNDEAIIAAKKASTDGQSVSLDYVAYTACDAPCDIDEYIGRDRLPWRLLARRAVLNQPAGTLELRGVRLELFDVPVIGFPRITIPAPSVKRRSGFLGPTFGYEAGLGAWGGVPLYLTQGPSADLTATPVIYGSGLARFDLEQRINTATTQAIINGTLDSQARGGLMVEASQQLSPRYDVSLNVDWAGETERGALQLLDQTALDDHSNQFSLQANKGHSFAALDLNQDVILAPDATGAALDWHENWVPRVAFDLRLPPPTNGSRVRLSGQGLLLDDDRVVETSAAWDARAITQGGLELTPRLEAGFMGNHATGAFSPWFGAQLGGAFPLVRHAPHTLVTLTPKIALSGLTQASVSGSPHDDNVLLSRSTMFDLRPAADPYSHDSDLRIDAAVDIAVLPNKGNRNLSLRASLAQRLSFADTAFAPAVAELQARAGTMHVNLRAETDTRALFDAVQDWDGALAAVSSLSPSRLSATVKAPLTNSIELSGSHRRLRTEDDHLDVNAVSARLDWTPRFNTTIGVRTRLGRSNINLDVEAGLAWNFAGDWVVETTWRQDVFDRADQEQSLDLFHRCNCLGAQFGVVREQSADGTDYSARFALDVPTLFSAKLSPTVYRSR